jgi:type IV secretory pathway component VirB8
LFPVRAMSKVFRAKYVAELRKHIPGLPQSLYDKLFSKNWVVYAKPPFLKPENVVEYLGRYTHKITIRLIKSTNKDLKQVTFTYKDYKQVDKTKQLTLSNDEFIRRFSLHILPKGLTRI